MAKKSLINKMKSKFLGGVLFLSNISLVSVSFSAWSIGMVGSAKAEIHVEAADLTYAINFKSLDSGYSFCKYGFVNSDGQIFDSATYAFCFSMNQMALKSLGYFDDNVLNFNLEIVNDLPSSKFITLFQKGYFSAKASLQYNSITGNDYALSSAYSKLAGEIPLTDLTTNDQEDLFVNLSFAVNSNSLASIATYFDSFTSSPNLSFSVSLGVIS